MKIICSICTI